MTPPPSLYKYEAFSTQSLLNLKRQIIYFGSPLNFNDPYDCALTPNIVDPSDAEVIHLRDEYLKGPGIPITVRSEFETSSISQLRASVLRAATTGFHQAVQAFLAKRGVACFSETNDNLLMWSHYGGRYKGFCLEFDTSSEPFRNVTPVRYVPKLPLITISQVLLDKTFSPIRELFCTKSTAWKYESEWRAIHAEAGTQYCYPSSALTGIYFGPDIEQQSMEIVCLILAGQNDTVKLWRGHRSTNEFKVNFEPMTYISHLEAKRNGLLE